jgi:hypothetical protein
MRRDPSRPLRLADLIESRDTDWIWLHCNRMGCNHSVAARYATLAEVLGAQILMDEIRRRGRCIECGNATAGTKTPSWVALGTGFQPFPTNPAMIWNPPEKDLSKPEGELLKPSPAGSLSVETVRMGKV